jgi:hypothetical protein
MEEKKLIGLNQIYSLEQLFKYRKEHFDIYNLENAFDDLKKMTEKQYKYILYLYGQNHYFKIKQILDKFLKHK